MALEALTAKANTGSGTDQLAVVSTAQGKAGAVALVDASGVLHDAANPVPVEIQGSIPVTIASAIEITNDAGNAIPVSAAALPLPTGAATEASLAAIAATVKAEDTAHTTGDPGVVMLAMRWDSDTPTAGSDGDYTVPKLDEAGRLKVAAQPAKYDLVTGNITSNGQTVFLNCSRGSNVIAHMVATSLVGHNASFEASIDSTNGTDGAWVTVDACRSGAVNTIEAATGVLAATPAYGWEISVNGYNWLRVRATAHTSGTATWKFQQAPYATEPAPRSYVTGTQPVSGTVTANQGTLTAPTASNVNSAATTNATSVKASAGTVYSVTASNVNAAARFVKLYNKASAPTVGTDVPVITIPIPATGVVSVNFGATGHRFATGIALAITTGMADSDTGAVAANEIKVATAYI